MLAALPCPWQSGQGLLAHGLASMLMHGSAVMQLAAGAEHVIACKTVRVNLAGPRPELPLLYMDPTQTQPMLIPQSTGKPAFITQAT